MVSSFWSIEINHYLGSTQSTFRSPEKHSKWHYKIHICSVILGELKSFLKIVHERNSHLEIFSCPQAEENSRQHLLLQTYVLQKQ